jgi:hypothetical protein
MRPSARRGDGVLTPTPISKPADGGGKAAAVARGAHIKTRTIFHLPSTLGSRKPSDRERAAGSEQVFGLGSVVWAYSSQVGPVRCHGPENQLPSHFRSAGDATRRRRHRGAQRWTRAPPGAGRKPTVQGPAEWRRYDALLETRGRRCRPWRRCPYDGTTRRGDPAGGRHGEEPRTVCYDGLGWKPGRKTEATQLMRDPELTFLLPLPNTHREHSSLRTMSRPRGKSAAKAKLQLELTGSRQATTDTVRRRLLIGMQGSVLVSVQVTKQQQNMVMRTVTARNDTI